jgi:hypothetical protein
MLLHVLLLLTGAVQGFINLPSPSGRRRFGLQLSLSVDPPPSVFDFTELDDDENGAEDASHPSDTGFPPDFSVLDDEGNVDDTVQQPEISDFEDKDNADDRPLPPQKNREKRDTQGKRQKPEQFSSSWVDRNAAYSKESKSFQQDFRGTRVFVQGLPPTASWQDMKDHFREHAAANVVFASVSSDPQTGISKCCGIVQFETTDMAEHAIKVMRDHPMDGFQLYVREDVQEQKPSLIGQKKGPTPPSKWKCANSEEDLSFLLTDEQIKAIRSLIKARDVARFRRQYDASDAMREQLKYEYSVHLDDRLNMWWVNSADGAPPEVIQEVNGEGRWGKRTTEWRQIPTTPDNDACVDPYTVNSLLAQRDRARREKDFDSADVLLEKARTSPTNSLKLRIHDESRTWRIWTDKAPPAMRQQETRSVAEQCMDIILKHAPEREDEIRLLLEKFPGREYNVLKKLKNRFL